MVDITLDSHAKNQTKSLQNRPLYIWGRRVCWSNKLTHLPSDSNGELYVDQRGAPWTTLHVERWEERLWTELVSTADYSLATAFGAEQPQQLLR